MLRTSGICALLLLAATTAACGFDILEDIGSDPHPPAVRINALVYFVPEETASAAAQADLSPQGRSVPWDSGGFTLATDQLFQIWIDYADTGVDIVNFQLRDRDGPLSQGFPPFEQTYFSGTAGAVLLPATGVDPVTGLDNPQQGIALTGILGRHRLEFWAEDSHGSRSEKVEFIITLVP